ncbi:MAG: alpha/beta hydrolase [Nitrospinota bacterium]
MTGLFLLISTAVYLAIAFTAILTSRPKRPEAEGLGDFSLLRTVDYRGLPPVEGFAARDGTRLAYRRYPAGGGKVLILIHGSAYHGRYLHDLARFVAYRDAAEVYTPDLRGHGRSGGRRGDADYVGQLEDDLAELIRRVRERSPAAKIVLAGHSSGGGLAVRFGGGKHREKADAYILLAPFLRHNAPTTRKNSAGWAMPYLGRFVGLSMLNNIGVRALNHMTVIDFNMPEEARDGTEVLSYSYAMSESFAPRRRYWKDLWSIARPLLVLVGEADEAFRAEAYAEVLAGHPTAEVKVLPGVSHLGIVVSPEAKTAVVNWLKGL